MKDPDSSRSVFIVSAQGNEVIIEVSQPSDCLLLQRDHVQCSQVESLTIAFGFDFTTKVNGPSELQSPDTWKEALHHLLNTYRPTYCDLTITGSQTGIQDGHQVDLTDGTSYKGYWNESKYILHIVR